MLTSQTSPEELQSLIFKIKESLGINSPRKKDFPVDQFYKGKSGEPIKKAQSGTFQSFRFNEGAQNTFLTINDLEPQVEPDQMSREMQTQIVKLITIAETLTFDFKNSEQSLNEQLEKNDRLEKIIQDYERDIMSLKRGSDEEKDIILQYETDFQKAREEVNGYREENRKLRSENNQLKREKLALEQENKEKSDQNAFLLKNESQLCDQVHSLKNDILNLKKQLESEKSMNSSYVISIKSLEDSNSSLRKTGKNNQENLERVMIENQNLLSQLKSRENQMHDLQLEHDMLKKCYEQKAFQFVSTHTTPFTERKQTLQTEMSDFIDCSASQSKLVRIEEETDSANDQNNDSMIFNDDPESQTTPTNIQMITRSKPQKQSKNVNALCNELSSSMTFEGQFGSQKQRDILNDSNVNESFFIPFNNNTILENSRIEYQMVTPSQSKPASRKQSKNIAISAHRRRTSSKQNRENVIKIAEATKKTKKKGVHFDPDKQFKKYLKKCYADVAFKRYEGILTNHSKIDVAKLKEKYANGQGPYSNSSGSDINTHTDSSSLSCKEELSQKVSYCQTDRSLESDGENCRCRLGEIIEERTQRYTEDLNEKSSHCSIF